MGVIENQELKRVGDTRARKIRVRVISATNEDLKHLTAEKKFRGDLLQRLTERIIQLPALRLRKDEIPGLVEHFARTMTGGPYKVAPSVTEVFMALEWDEGNVRELRNTLKAMTEYSADQTLTPLAIPSLIWDKLDKSEREELKAAPGTNGERGNSLTIQWDRDVEHSFEHLADLLLIELLERARKSLSKLSMRKLSSEVGMPRTTLSERLKRLLNRGLIDKAVWSDLLRS